MIVIAQASVDLPLWMYIVVLLLGNLTGFGLIWWRKRRKISTNKQQEE